MTATALEGRSIAPCAGWAIRALGAVAVPLVAGSMVMLL
jgi:hypothetical protein